MHEHALLIERFYRAFQARDALGMAACYAPDVAFSDPVFPQLEGARATAMWQMLCARGKDLVLSYEGIEADEHSGKARWIAHYTFSKTGRKVTNVIDARFTFRSGLIARHVDSFDFHRWSRQALGPVGLLLGFTGFLQRKVQTEAARGLDAFIAQQSGT